MKKRITAAELEKHSMNGKPNYAILIWKPGQFKASRKIEQTNKMAGFQNLKRILKRQKPGTQMALFHYTVNPYTDQIECQRISRYHYKRESGDLATFGKINRK